MRAKRSISRITHGVMSESREGSPALLLAERVTEDSSQRGRLGLAPATRETELGFLATLKGVFSAEIVR